MGSALLIGIVLILVGLLINILREQDKLKKRLQKYDGIVSKEELEQKLDNEINVKQSQKDRLVLEHDHIYSQIQILQSQLSELEEAEYIQSFGFYKSKYDFGSSEAYKIKLNQIRARQKNILRNDAAAVCLKNWEVEGSQKKGEKLTKSWKTLIVRAFNGECDAAISQVKYNNASKIENQIIKSFEKLNKLGEAYSCSITRDYLDLKLKELYLTHEYQEKRQEEAEEQRRIREQIRQEEKARRELEQARKEAEKEVQRKQQALEQARQEIEQAVGQQREQMEVKIQQLTQQLEEACANEQRAVSRAQMTKSGYVYVISNIGSFGENVYKIGMTRRLYPEERVKELSGASVPFPFDIHAIISSENAPETETLLHQCFRDKSVNKVNERKEFFKVTLDEIAAAVGNIAKETKTVKQAEIQFTQIAEAQQYRKTLAIESGEAQSSEPTYTPLWDEDEEDLQEVESD